MPESEEVDSQKEKTWVDSLDQYFFLILLVSYYLLDYALKQFNPDIEWWWAPSIVCFTPIIILFFYGMGTGLAEEIRNPSPWPNRNEVLTHRSFIRKGFIHYVIPTVIIVETIRWKTGLLDQLSGWIGMICFLWGATFVGTYIWTIPEESENEEYTPEFIIPAEAEGDTNTPFESE